MSPARTRGLVPSLPFDERGTGNHQSPSVVMCSNPSLVESRGVEHFLPYGEELAGSTQAPLPLSTLTSPHRVLAIPGGTETSSVSFSCPFRDPNTPSPHTNWGPYSDRVYHQHLGAHPLVAMEQPFPPGQLWSPGSG